MDVDSTHFQGYPPSFSILERRSGGDYEAESSDTADLQCYTRWRLMVSLPFYKSRCLHNAKVISFVPSGNGGEWLYCHGSVSVHFNFV